MESADGTLAGLLGRLVARQPHAPALIEHDRTITYAQFDVLSRQTAAWLAAHGVGCGDRVAVWLPNRVEWLALLFGLGRLGATLVAINAKFRAAELEQVLQRCTPRMMVFQPRFRRIDFAAILREMPPEAARSLESVIALGTDRPIEIWGKQVIPFDPFSGKFPDARDRSDPDAIVAMFTTSGTTKGPKLVMHPQRSIAAHARAIAAGFGMGPQSRVLGALPLSGVFGFDTAVGALAGGSATILMDFFDAGETTLTMAHHRITHAFGSDEMVRRLGEFARGNDPFPSLRIFGFAAFQPGSGELARAGWERRIPLVGLYGSSEVQALFAFQPLALPLEQRIQPGGLPVAGSAAEVRIRDIETGELAPVGSNGEIEIRAPSLFVGYCDDPEATAAALRADGFLRTGDIGCLRGDGTFVFETRRGDALRLGGFLVSPAEIEDALKRIPGIADAQTVGIEFDGRIRCVAFVIPAGGAHLTEAQVIARSANLMAPFKLPSNVWFLESFPVTESANGTKIQRGKLREMAIERLRASYAA